jgi:Zn ribbon nucleic-acid-binding protein
MGTMETTTMIETANVELRKCIKCGRELPLDQFYKDKRMISGLKSVCKECTNEYNRIRHVAKREEKESTPLSKFTPRELIEELRRRGYKGKLQYVYEVVI